MPSLTASKLAIHGGEKIRKTKFPAYRTIGSEEQQAAQRVLESGILSRFLGMWHEDFFGGPEVQAFEKEWASHFKVKHAVAMNSATSGLFAAVGATGVEPGEEIIVPPYTMSATAVAPLVYNAIPVFADVEPEYFCLDPKSIEARITPRTRAIMVVDLFGQPYDAEAINAIARKHNLLVIEDCAQAPGGLLNGKPAGTLADMGVYSLNYHKHIHTGEGCLVVTDNDELAEKLRLIRNHAESVVQARGMESWTNMLGFNYRMTELEAAIGREQLKKLDGLLEARLQNVAYLNEKLGQIPCLKPGLARPGAKHAYYVHALRFDSKTAGVHRNHFIDAVKAELEVMELRETEGVKISAGYVKPLYLLPIFQNRSAYGTKGFPWSMHEGSVDYSQGSCPVVENLHFESLIMHEYIRPPMSKADLDDVVDAFSKVWEHRKELV